MKRIAVIFIAVLCVLSAASAQVFADYTYFKSTDGFGFTYYYSEEGLKKSPLKVISCNPTSTSVNLDYFGNFKNNEVFFEPYVFTGSGITEITLGFNKFNFDKDTFGVCDTLTRINLDLNFTSNIPLNVLFGRCKNIKDIYFNASRYNWLCNMGIDYSDKDSAFSKATVHFSDGETAPVNTYTDIESGKWYVPFVNKVINEKIMVGVSETEFKPDAPLTREQAVALIFANKNITVPNYSSYSFSDVKDGAWYANIVEYAYRTGYTAGIGGGKFGVGKPISREDFFTMYYNMFYKNIKTAGAGYSMLLDDEYKNFKDIDTVSGYAFSAVEFLAGWYATKYYGSSETETKEIRRMISGDDGFLMPKNNVTRAQAATFFPIQLP